MTDLGLPFEVHSEDGMHYEIDVYPMTVENVGKLWRQFSQHKLLFGDQLKDDARAFIRMIMARDTIVLRVSSCGILYATDLIPGHTAKGHYFFWDRVTEGRHAVILQGLKWTVDAFDLHRIDIEVPRYAYAALHRIYRIGFRLEGVQRESILHNGKWCDLFQFGVLADELTDRVLKTGVLERIGDERGWFGLLKKDADLMNYIARKS